jgi:hypothetical protein
LLLTSFAIEKIQPEKKPLKSGVSGNPEAKPKFQFRKPQKRVCERFWFWQGIFELSAGVY